MSRLYAVRSYWMLALTLLFGLGLALIVTSLARAQNAPVTIATHCFVEANGDDTTDYACNFTAPGDMTDTNPLVGPLADSEGSARPGGVVMQTHALLAGSPALDQIPPGECAVAADQGGVSRHQGTDCDIDAYEIPYFYLTVARAGSGTGLVTGPGIDCGADCDEIYIYAARITLTAKAEVPSTFAGWSGDCSGSAPTCSLTMKAPAAVTANFALLQRVFLPLVFHKEP